MKTANDPRHKKRIGRVQALFAYAFDPAQIAGVEDIAACIPELDSKIASVATERPLAQVSRIDLAILRVSVYELIKEDQLPSVIIDEAVEIAKEFGSDASPKFIHAVLSKIAE